ncbi:unnamed protein product, partial [Rotaria magnacalcarata]
VQKERDRLGRQRNHNYNSRMDTTKSTTRLHGDVDEDDDLSIMALLRAEQTAKEVRKKKKIE